jgi:hypothetical protein
VSNGYMAYIFVVGLLYGFIIGSLAAAKALGW